jgi:hypothetical protein
MTLREGGGIERKCWHWLPSQAIAQTTNMTKLRQDGSVGYNYFGFSKQVRHDLINVVANRRRNRWAR